MVKHPYINYCKEAYKKLHLLAQMSEALNFTEMVFASLSAMPFSWIQTLWYLYFCPRLNLVILLVNPPSIKVLIASTPCSNDASICPVEINSQNVAAVLKKIQMHPYKYRAIGTKSIQQLFNQKMWVLNNCADIDSHKAFDNKCKINDITTGNLKARHTILTGIAEIHVYY